MSVVVHASNPSMQKTETGGLWLGAGLVNSTRFYLKNKLKARRLRAGLKWSVCPNTTKKTQQYNNIVMRISTSV
jgi:hypothetical protein